MFDVTRTPAVAVLADAWRLPAIRIAAEQRNVDGFQSLDSQRIKTEAGGRAGAFAR